MPIFEFWGDGAAGPQALTTSFASGAGITAAVRIADPADLVCRADIAGADATNIEMRVQMREINGGATDWITLPMVVGESTIMTVLEGVASIDGAIATDVPVFFHVPGNCDIRVQARRVGGTAATTLYLEGYRRYNRDSPKFDPMSMGLAGGSYDPSTGADSVSVINGPQTDRDQSPQVLANVTNVVGATNYPSDAGKEIGDRDFLTFNIEMRDGSFDFEVSKDGVRWDNVTKQVVDNSEGVNGYDNTHYAEADVAITDFSVDWERCGHLYIRVVFTPADATNSFVCTLTQRAL